MNFLGRALELAELALGRTSPNPAVGAVVVRDGRIVGEGFTQPPGSAHAEVGALPAAGPGARGADLYVTLEPCCHYGRTPPCTNAVIAAGIRRVVVATLDPNPQVDGGGVAALRQAGIAVEIGDQAEAARRLNAAFVHFVRTGRPLVTAKWAMTLDGRIATASGDSRWVTGEPARRLAHLERDASDAILVGIGTVLADDPRLTIRLEPADDRRPRRLAAPWRVVLDTQARLPLDAHLVCDNNDRRTLVFVGEQAPVERVHYLQARGVDVVIAPTVAGRIELSAALAALAQRGAIRVLAEGGSELLGSLFAAGRVDRVLAFIAPKLVGGRAAPGPLGAVGRDRMAEAMPLREVDVRTVGEDILIEGWLDWQE
jgi:diaminohydroxyphosphoribosylaminopyrimidine deaminase/5-amino-6-(5-phosphoribosylamino)uracil reductase